MENLLGHMTTSKAQSSVSQFNPYLIIVINVYYCVLQIAVI